MTVESLPPSDDRPRRRLEVLEALREAAALRARLQPRKQQIAKARALLRHRTTRG